MIKYNVIKSCTDYYRNNHSEDKIQIIFGILSAESSLPLRYQGGEDKAERYYYSIELYLKPEYRYSARYIGKGYTYPGKIYTVH